MRAKAHQASTSTYCKPLQADPAYSVVLPTWQMLSSRRFELILRTYTHNVTLDMIQSCVSNADLRNQPFQTLYGSQQITVNNITMAERKVEP